jgi:mannose-6-phosphate isomerase-like protein (cupin superfamily)
VLEVFEGASGAANDGRQRLVGDGHCEPGLAFEELVEAAKERATADERQTATGDIRGEFRRRPLEHKLDRLDDLLEGLLQRDSHLVDVNCRPPQQTAIQVASRYLRGQRTITARDRRADLDLQPLGLLLTDQQSLLPLKKPNDGFVQVIASDTNCVTDHHPSERGHGHLRRAAANVDHERADGFPNRQVGTDRGGQGLLDEKSAAGARGSSRVLDSRTLDLCSATGDTDHHIDATADPAEYTTDEVAEHLLGDVEVGDHPVAQRPRRPYMRRRSADHLPRLLAHCEHLAAVLVNSHDRWLEQHDSSATAIHDGVRRSEVECQLTLVTRTMQRETPDQLARTVSASDGYGVAVGHPSCRECVDSPSDGRCQATTDSHRICDMPFTRRNIKEDLEDIGSRFDGRPNLEFRAATKALELEKAALSYQSIPPDYRFPYGHSHQTQEEVYVVVRGSGRMKVDDDIVELREWDAVRVPPGSWRGYEAGPEGLELLVVGAPNLGDDPREDVSGRRDWWTD